MLFNVGDLVTRNSYQNDVVFKIISINGKTAYLKGLDMRLYADADIEDLSLEKGDTKSEEEELKVIKELDTLDRSEFFYIPGKILHIDGDEDYLNRCMNFYKKLNIMSYGICLSEQEVSENINRYLAELKPDILVITGHDAFYSKKGTKDNLKNYKNSENFINSVREARVYEKSHDKLIIIAGACQSDYEELIKVGATFASSPKRVNIHALDPAIVASSVALSDRTKNIELLKIIEKTKYGKDGIGGIITNGSMYVGFPR